MDQEPPPELICPMTLQVMTDPVILSPTGHTYERAVIEQWLQTQNTDPKTNVPLDRSQIQLIPNHNIKMMCQDWRAGRLNPNNNDSTPEFLQKAVEVHQAKQLVEAKVLEIEFQNTAMEKVHWEVQQKMKTSKEDFDTYENFRHQFNNVSDEVKEMCLGEVVEGKVEQLENKRAELSTAFDNLKTKMDIVNHSTWEIIKVRKNYQKEIAVLEEKEKELKALKDDLEEKCRQMEKLHNDSGPRLEPTATSKDFKKFIPPTKVDVHTFQKQISAGEVKNVEVHINKTSNYEIKIYKDLTVEGLHITNAKRGCNYLRIKPQGNQKIVFDRCNFDSIGLIIWGNNQGNAVVVNTEVVNAPCNGLEFKHLGNVAVSKVRTNNCGENGCNFHETNGSIKSSSFNNSEQFGIKLSHGTVTYESVALTGNKRGKFEEVDNGKWETM